MLKKLRAAVLGLCVAGLVACGGGGGGSTSSAGASSSSSSSGGSSSSSSSSSGGSSSSGTTQPSNVLPVVIDGGPTTLGANNSTINELFATVTLCTHGSTSACEVIDHVQIDTGSVGLRIISSTLSGAAQLNPINDPVSGNALYECSQFADGYTWGAMVTADVTVGSRTLSNLPVNIIGQNPGNVTVPSSCSSGLTAENTVAQFQANGILGIGNYVQDCGTACSQGELNNSGVLVPPTGYYYVCPSGTCSPVLVPVAQQASNPVAKMSSDNNGVLISLPSVGPSGAGTTNGSVIFGINTQSNNQLGSAQLMTLDSNGDVQTTFGGSVISQSFLDTGSNGYFFNSSLTVCTTSTSFYCPASTVNESGVQIQGQNSGVIKTVSFAVSNAESLFQNNIFADAGLAGPATASGNGAFQNYFDWGLPFFFGRPVYVLFETGTIGTVQGPATGF